MPILPVNNKCATLGCKNSKAKHGSNCIEHGGTDTFNRKYRQTDLYKVRMDKYKSKEWQATRIRQLSESPICAGCFSGGIITPANTVDHVFPWMHISEEAFTYNIFQSLCTQCHSSKTGLESKGIYRLYGKPNKDYTIKDYAFIMRMKQTL